MVIIMLIRYMSCNNSNYHVDKIKVSCNNGDYHVDKIYELQ